MMNVKTSDLEKLYASAVENHLKGNQKVAKDLYKKILEAKPNHINTQTNLGALYAQFGERKKAMNIFEKILEIEPNNVNANENLGLLLTETLKYNEAIECHKKVIKINPNHADAHNHLATNYKYLGDSESAEKNFYKAMHK